MATVLPTLGWFGVIVIAVLLGTRVANGRMQISAESHRSHKIRALLLRQLNPRRRWARQHASESAGAYLGSTLKQHQPSDPLGDGATQVVIDAPPINR